jgi:hypothetical protein
MIGLSRGAVMVRRAGLVGVLILAALASWGCTAEQRVFGTGSSGTGGAGGTGSTGGSGGGGPALPCTVPTDCPGKETQCAQRTCDAGFCGQKFAAHGTHIDAQGVGDCHVIVCDGKGNLDVLVDDSDVPDDDNPCTKDICANGTPSNPPEPASGACGSGLSCDGNGHCTGCQGPESCPGLDTECEQRSCTSGTCGFLYAPSGTSATAQMPGDCKKNVCNGLGHISVVFDATDAPDSGNECIIDGCSMGTPVTSPKAAGGVCAETGGVVCDGAGHCVECLVATSCPGADTDCATPTCTSGACGTTYAASGAPVTAQTANDCQTSVCDGQGNVTQIADDTDLPSADNPCTTPSCNGSVPVQTPVPQGTACGGVNQCDGQGNCVGCVTAADCPGSDGECAKQTCTGGVCGTSYTPSGTPIAAQTVGDCALDVCNGAGAVASIVDDSDVPVDGDACTSDVCAGGTPSNPPAPAGTACGAGGVCNGSGACGVCAPGTSRFCCGPKTTFCCNALAPEPPCDPATQSCAPKPKEHAGGGNLVCCCDSAQDCDATGHWGSCY